MTTITITLTHEGKTYTSQESDNTCTGCAFESEPIHHPVCNLRDCQCELMDIIWIEQQESPLDMPGFKAQKAYNGCDVCCGQPNTCEQPCFHTSGRTTPGNPGAIASVPDASAAPDKMAADAQELGQCEPVAVQLLNEAAATLAERGRQYDQDEGERSFDRAAAAYVAVHATATVSTGSDVALLLTLLKLVRDQSREVPHRDSLLDATAYASLYGEARLMEGA